jgi:hypothetical protein
MLSSNPPLMIDSNPTKTSVNSSTTSSVRSFFLSSIGNLTSANSPDSEEPVPLDLPIQWLWDMLDEFVYQFQSFAQWRANASNKTEEELDMLTEAQQVWSCYSVLNVLYSLVQKSEINAQLKAEKEGKSAEEVA